MKKIIEKLKWWATIAAVVIGLVALVGGCNYASYSMYHAKYPQTGFWTWLFDTKN